MFKSNTFFSSQYKKSSYSQKVTKQSYIKQLYNESRHVPISVGHIQLVNSMKTFTADEFNKTLLDQQPRQCLDIHLCSHLTTAKAVAETSVVPSPFNDPTRLLDDKILLHFQVMSFKNAGRFGYDVQRYSLCLLDFFVFLLFRVGVKD